MGKHHARYYKRQNRVEALNEAHRQLKLPIKYLVEHHRYIELPDGTAKIDHKPYRLTNTVTGETFGNLTANECWLILTAELRILIKLKQHTEYLNVQT